MDERLRRALLAKYGNIPEDVDALGGRYDQLAEQQALDAARSEKRQKLAAMSQAAAAMGSVGGKGPESTLPAWAESKDTSDARRTKALADRLGMEEKLVQHLAKIKADKEAQDLATKRWEKEQELAAARHKETMGAADKRHSESLANARKIAEMNNKSKADLAANKPPAGAMTPRDTNKEVRLLSKDLKGAQEMSNALLAVEDKLGFSLDDYDSKTNSVAGEEIDAPGVNLPFAGRVGFYSSDARELNGRIAKVFNSELKDRSGAAVTNPEMNRLREEFNSGKFNSESEMIAALKLYKEMLGEELRNREAAYEPESVATYEGRGGFTSNTFANAPKPSSGASRIGGTARANPSGLPKPGDIVDGYKYKGGDPADPNSWEEVE